MREKVDAAAADPKGAAAARQEAGAQKVQIDPMSPALDNTIVYQEEELTETSSLLNFSSPTCDDGNCFAWQIVWISFLKKAFRTCRLL